jgi:CHAT domain-containing protein/tetratricopeptide (TPR) repeat protein
LVTAAEAIPVATRPQSALAAWTAAVVALERTAPASLSLADAYRRQAAALYYAGEADRALAQAQRAVAIFEQRPAAQQALGDVLGEIGQYLLSLQKYDQAQEALTRAHALRVSAYPAGHPKIAWTLAKLGVADVRRGRLQQGRERLEQAVTMADAALPVGALDRVEHRSSYGNALWLLAEKEKAEATLRDAAEEARLLGPDHPTRAMALSGLAHVLLTQGRLAEAAGLYEQSIAVQKSAEATRPDTLAEAIGALAHARLLQDRPEEAEPLFVECQRLMEQDGAVYSGLNCQLSAGTAASRRGDRRLGFERRKATLDRLQAIPNANPVAIGVIKFKVADSYAEVGDFAAAETMEREAIAVLAKVRPEGHFQRLIANITLSWIEAQAGRAAAAAPRARAAVERLRADDRRLEVAEAKTTGVLENLEAFGRALHVAYLADDRDFGFAMAQVLIESDAGRAAALEKARIASGSDPLSDALRLRQTLMAERLKIDAERLKTLNGDAAKGAELGKRLAELDTEIESVEARLDREFPDYRALTRPEPITIREAQARLDEAEALVVPVATDQGLFTLALTRTGFTWDLAPVIRPEIRRLAARVRAGLGPDAEGPFDAEAAHALHQAIFTSKIRALTDATTTYTIAADPALSAVPFQVLLTEAAGAEGDYRRLPWLVRKAALQMAPSIQAMRPSEAPPARDVRFFGAGAPALQGVARPQRALYRAGAPDLDQVRDLAPLPRAAEELDQMARAFGRRRAEVIVGAAATEAAVRSAPLENATVVAFATHGLVAGDLDGLAEPALVFTPPASPSPADDALLTATEATLLKMNADWVVLSACNTATGDARDAPGHAGLARAFMFAGARRVLASHWPVRDDAAARLTVDAVRSAQAGATPAEALRSATLRLMIDRRVPDAANPSVWAPFTLIGR